MGFYKELVIPSERREVKIAVPMTKRVSAPSMKEAAAVKVESLIFKLILNINNMIIELL